MFEIFGIQMSLTVYIIVFTVCQLINVALNTAKTIIMHKEEKISSSIINAITFGFYAIIVVMTASALPLWITILITTATNLVGVYGSMWVLERFKKDKLWEIVATVQEIDNLQYLMLSFSIDHISYNYMKTNKDNEYVFHIYSENQKQSMFIKKELDYVNAKYIVHEERVKL
jgi:hypothetical protein